ncbi:MAG: mechanosensitive ion channel family protein [Bacteroidota bacterium]
MPSRLLFLLALTFLVLPIDAQQGANPLLSSPAQSLKTHLENLQPESYNDSLAAVPFITHSENQRDAVASAVKLKQILDGEGIYIDLTEVPRQGDHYDSLAKDYSYQLTSRFPEVVLRRRRGNWVYSPAAIEAIDRYYGEVFKYGTDRLLEVLPRAGSKKYLGLYLYQYIGLFLLALVGAVIHKILSFVLGRFLLSTLKKTGYGTFASRVLRPVAQPLSLFLVFFLLSVFIPVLQLPPSMTRYIVLGMRALLPLFGTILFYRLVNVLTIYLEGLAEKTESTLDDQLIPLLRKTLKTFIILIGTLFILDGLEINIIPLLTGLSIGGLAFALAAQDTIKNFFGSLMIFIDKPFQIGDWITSGDIDGSVEEVGFRSSRIRTFRNSLMYVPNGNLADSMIDNHGARVYRRFYTQLGVQYDTPAALIEVFVEGLKQIVENHPDTRKDYYNVYFNDMAASSLNIMFYIFFKVPDWPAELKARHEVLLEIIKLAEHLGVNFAFPTQTLHVETMPGQLPLSATYVDREGAKQKLHEYFHKGKEG